MNQPTSAIHPQPSQKVPLVVDKAPAATLTGLARGRQVWSLCLTLLLVQTNLQVVPIPSQDP